MYDNITKETLVRIHFGCEIGDVAKTVILTPIWKLESFKAKAEKIIKEFEGWYRGVTLLYKNSKVTVISSGIGSPMSGDCALALSYTDCEFVIFSGSAGAINKNYNIGDMLAVSEAVIGEGFSRYHRKDITEDCFGELAVGSNEIAEGLVDAIRRYETSLGIKSFIGRIFTIDSILGERKDTFDYMLGKGCDAVEMEVSAVFTACRCGGKKAAALILISDLPLRYRNLFEGISDDEIRRYNGVRSELPEILLEAASGLYK